MKKLLPKVIQKNLLYLAIVIFLAVTILPSMYFYFKGQHALQEAQMEKTGSSAGEAELKKIVGQVGKLVLLPDETPTLATVTDKEKLSGQSFYAQAENGDKVLIYAAAKKAYLYRPSVNKIIEIAPVTVGKTASSSAK